MSAQSEARTVEAVAANVFAVAHDVPTGIPIFMDAPLSVALGFRILANVEQLISNRSYLPKSISLALDPVRATLQRDVH